MVFSPAWSEDDELAACEGNTSMAAVIPMRWCKILSDGSRLKVSVQAQGLLQVGR